MILTVGCANFRHLAKEVDMLNRVYVEYRVTIQSQHETESFVFVQLQSLDADTIDGYEVVIGNQQITVTGDTNSQYLFTFNDTNNDLRFQVGEAFSINLLAEDTSKPLLLRLSNTQDNYPKALVDTPLNNLLNVNFSPAKIGEQADLDAPQFDREMAELGMWKPITHLKQGNSGVFFIDDFDTSKIPVLFIHGMNGTARDFAPLIAKLDRQKYQVWVMNYPSGLSIELLANGLNSLIKIIDYRYDVKTFHLVAHSMGGLVTQAYLDLCRNQLGCDDIASFTSISTPFGGVESAQSGVDYAPVVMPAWRNLAPESDFIATLFTDKFADKHAGDNDSNRPAHQLVFGYKVSGIINKKSSDGVISLDSQLRDKAQQQAERVYGLNEDHVSILSNDNLANALHQFWLKTEKQHLTKHDGL
ncbi:PGAP1 family protein [Shewanella pealeana ATCC 700345]|uniref:PGAP1 family protein n=2 Tax=Shewanella pealeana TaxID=70864 RepID=A8H913_SHEPA|nr:PGAP1 family protein [Shewanella pealeana ATCC 700345]